MAKLLYQLEGVRGRSIWIFDRKCVIATKAGVGSFLTGNVSDGQKTIFYTDVVGIQFKKSGGLIGYLQFETGSVQMNNQNSNMFSENTFTFEHGKNGITNDQMEGIYHQVCDLIESVKYGNVTSPALNQPAAPAQTAQQIDNTVVIAVVAAAIVVAVCAVTVAVVIVLKYTKKMKDE
jgi:imidazolonepropionase-like amidohydrolase